MLLLQYGAAFAKELFAVVGPDGATTLRLFFAAATLAALTRPWRTRLSRKVLPSLLGYGASLAAMNLLFYLAIRTIPLGIAVALEFVGPLLVATVASRRGVDFVWIGLAIAGIAMLSSIFRADRSLDPVGLALALAAGACWALYIVCGQKAGKELGSSTTVFGMLVAVLVMAPIGIGHAEAALVAPSILFKAMIVGVLFCALPFSLEMAALRRMPAKVYGTLTSLEPATGAVMGFAFLGERLTAVQWDGVAAIGVATTSRIDILPPAVTL